VFHRTVKSGCRIEDRRWDTADRLEACLAIDLVASNSQSSRRTRRVRVELAEFASWRIYALVKQGRETPDLPCDVYLAEEEWKVCCTPGRRRRRHCGKPSGGLLLWEGFLGARGTGTPGTTTTWRGLERLSAMVEGWQLYQTMHPARASL